MEITRPENKHVLKYLSRKKLWGAPPFVPPTGVPDPYLGCGCHPDIVERIWDQIGAVLPPVCRGLVYGTPALVHSKSKIILAIGIGTQYALRLPEELVKEAVSAGARTSTIWSDGSELNTHGEFGPDWIFGSWSEKELEWCKRAFQLFDT